MGYDNDIGILKLVTPIPEGNGIAYVKLPALGSDPAANSSSTTAGWLDLSLTLSEKIKANSEYRGSLTLGGSGPPDLRYVDVPIVSRAECKSEYPSSSITENMVCAGVLEGGKDSCSGDSGGPLIATGTDILEGIVSWGQGCALKGFAGVYTRVATQLDFIYANANSTS